MFAILADREVSEMYDPIEMLKEAIATRNFEERYNRLLNLYYDSLSDYKKPKAEQVFYPELKRLIRTMFLDVYEIKEKSM